MKNETASFDFTVPKDSPVEAERGKKSEIPYSYVEVENVDEANKVCADKEWDFIGLVNAKLKASAKSNAYQAELAKHRVSTLSPEDMFESAVRQLIRMGIPEDVARKQLEGMKAAVA